LSLFTALQVWYKCKMVDKKHPASGRVYDIRPVSRSADGVLTNSVPHLGREL
jgi:hypothetical protein